jgi:hypothetical protein
VPCGVSDTTLIPHSSPEVAGGTGTINGRGTQAETCAQPDNGGE